LRSVTVLLDYAIELLLTTVDPTLTVVDLNSHGKLVILVTFNYRLNIFAFGDGKGPPNLALKDQRTLIDWVVDDIGGFGGDQVCLQLFFRAENFAQISIIVSATSHWLARVLGLFTAMLMRSWVHQFNE
jgi:hypothetical protein